MNYENIENLYSDSSCKIFCGDSRHIIKSAVKDLKIMMIYADPPYRLSCGGITCASGKMQCVNKADWDVSAGTHTDYEYDAMWISECHEVLHAHGSIWISGTYHNIYRCGNILQEKGWHILNEVIWFKSNAPPNLSCRLFTASHENIIWAKKDKMAKQTFNYKLMKDGGWSDDKLKRPGRQMRTVWQIPPAKVIEKRFGRHPTQKPEALLERIILASTNEGDWILDPFCGTGTTGVVALRNGRNFVGIDNSKAYLADIALPRVLSATRGGNGEKSRS